MPMPIKPLPPTLLPPHRRRATLRKGRGLQQVQSAMGSPQVQLAPRRRKNNKKGRGKCFNGIIKRLLKSDLTGEEFEQAKLLLAKIFPRRGIVRGTISGTNKSDQISSILMIRIIISNMMQS